jgi:LysR family transcriptional regulator of beta-lactamase
MPNQQQILTFLPWVRTFEAAARRMNFTEAANELGLSQAAVSQQIKLLESALGVKLFERGRRGVTITADAAAFLPHVQSAFGALTRSAGELFADNISQRVVIYSPISFAALWLAPKLPDLARDLPNIKLDIKTVLIPADYDQKDIGFAIRYGSGTFAGCKSHRLTHERLVPVTSPKALNPGSTKLDWDGVWDGLPLLSVTGPREVWAQWFDSAGLTMPGLPMHRFDSFVAAMAAAQAGAGVLLGSRPLIDGALTSGELIRLSEVEFVSENSHYITYETGASLDYAKLSLLDWLQSQHN